MMTQSFCYVSSKVINLPIYDGLNDVDVFLDAFERKVPEKKHFQALDWALGATLVRWWGTHKGGFDDWCESQEDDLNMLWEAEGMNDRQI